MGRVLPDRYPADDELDSYLRAEHRFGRILDYAVILPRVDVLYDWSARELDRPEVARLVVDGTPAYAWASADRQEWESPRLPVAGRALRALSAPASGRSRWRGSRGSP